jgi:hypothetical protein
MHLLGRGQGSSDFNFRPRARHYGIELLKSMIVEDIRFNCFLRTILIISLPGPGRCGLPRADDGISPLAGGHNSANFF